MRELLGRKRDYPGLLDQIAGAYTKRIERALKLGLYARGRRVLHEFAELTPEHVMIKTMRTLYVTKAKEILKETEGLNGPERLDRTHRALRIWPELEGATSLYEKAFAAEPTLDVAVSDVATPLGPWVRSPADLRVTRLLYRPILASNGEDARKGKKPGQLAASLESSDLGRRLLVKIHPGFFWSDGSRPVSAIDVARDLVDRTDPHSPRFRSTLGRVARPGRSHRSNPGRRPAKPGAVLQAGLWLLGPVGPAHASIDGRVASSGRDRPLVSDGNYQALSRQRRASRIAAARRQGDIGDRAGDGVGRIARLAVPHIKRVRETRLPPGQSTVAALRRGEVSLIDHVPPDQVAGLAASADIKVGSYADPQIHLIALDGRNQALRSRSLRRAPILRRGSQGFAGRPPSQARGHREGYGCRRCFPQG